ncbi:AraC family transcriptional regulator [Galbibacter marinus]|uniref:AraC family transcriptional regulator n=1 Tax=Galbibacter marinus TaxID=555500 RepID=K2PPP7_9FLAO|nr:AraC family transcriptional regulator [Galbibacter marinus]EKF54525.1 AraC family transcriptional regulator [Galbibacter marinus]
MNGFPQYGYEIQSIVLSDLSTPVKLPELAKRLGMSETKMKALFKQIFGDSFWLISNSGKNDFSNSIWVSKDSYFEDKSRNNILI